MANIQRYNEGLIKLNAWVRKLLAINPSGEELYKTICQGACAVVGAENSALQTVASGRLLISACVGKECNKLQSLLPSNTIDEICKTEIAARGKPFRFENLENSQCREVASLSSVPATTAIFVTVQEDDHILGCLSAFRCGTPFDTLDEQLLQQFAHATTAMLISAQLQEELRTRAAELEVEIAEREEAERALQSSERKFRALVENSPDWVWSVDQEGAFTYVCPRVRQFLGYEEAELLGRTLFEFMPADEAVQAREFFSAVAKKHYPFSAIESRLFHRDGYALTFEVSGTPFFNADGSLGGYYGITRDISRRKEAELALTSHLGFFQRVIDTIPFPMYYTDTDGRFQWCNRTFQDSFGVANDDIRGKTPAELKKIWLERGGEIEMAFVHQIEEEESNERTVTYADRSLHQVLFSRTPITDEDGSPVGTAVVLIDFTERRRAEDSVRKMAYYDPLTGLPNRYLFREILGRAQWTAQRAGDLLAVLFLDLDRFKIINETLGHLIGDLLLQGVAQRLREASRRETDTVARRGGDEFLILLTGVKGVEDAVRIAQKIIDSVARPFIVAEHELFVSTSIGISIYPHDGKDVETLVRNADIAMYRAKEHGKNTFRLYTEAMNASSFERLSLENSLRKGLEREELELFYQPKVDVSDGRIGSCEALVRWRHPDMGLVTPGLFIPLAEETGLIVPLGEWVLRRACEQNIKWQREGHPPVRVAVNLSPRQFMQADLVDMVEGVLAETGLDPRWLELEMTENVMIKNVAKTADTLHGLARLGIHISIDDFGTGYSSLNYLKRFPIHTLKIDRSFVSDITSNKDDAAIAKAVITLAHSLKLGVIAEGVETREQLDLLCKLHCHKMQGNFFSRPVPPEQFMTIIKKGGWAASDVPIGSC